MYDGRNLNFNPKNYKKLYYAFWEIISCSSIRDIDALVTSFDKAIEKNIQFDEYTKEVDLTLSINSIFKAGLKKTSEIYNFNLQNLEEDPIKNIGCSIYLLSNSVLPDFVELFFEYFNRFIGQINYNLTDIQPNDNKIKLYTRIMCSWLIRTRLTNKDYNFSKKNRFFDSSVFLAMKISLKKFLKENLENFLREYLIENKIFTCKIKENLEEFLKTPEFLEIF